MLEQYSKKLSKWLLNFVKLKLLLVNFSLDFVSLSRNILNVLKSNLVALDNAEAVELFCLFLA